MRILCLGAGAVGGYLGARLIEAGADVTFCVRKQRRQMLAANGLRVESCYGDFAAPVKAVVKFELTGPFDVILLACKAYDIAEAVESIATAVGPNSTILPILNGIAHIDLLNAKYGSSSVLGGVVKIAATLTADGTIRHLNDWHCITFGEQDGTLSDRVGALRDTFERTSVVATAVPDIMRIMWEKLIHLATTAGMTSVMRANIGEILRTQEGAGLLHEIIERNAEIARREGFEPTARFLTDLRQMVSNTTSTQTTSILRDLEV
jgi:2-dehydropantoate 2-reductase